MEWTRSASEVLASFLASLVEFVEALTIVLALGVTRGRRSAITEPLLAAALLAALVAVFGTSLEAIPIRKLQLLFVLLLLVCGMRRLWNAILRASGVLGLPDETRIFARQPEALRLSGAFRNITIDGVGFIARLKAGTSAALVAVPVIKHRAAPPVLASGILLGILYCTGVQANAQPVNATESRITKAEAQVVGAPVEDSTIAAPGTKGEPLPDSPQPAQVTSQPGGNGSQQAPTGDVSGTVLDTNGDVIEGAQVALSDQSGSVIQTVESGRDGQFAFTGLPPNIYRITATRPGMTTYASTPIPLHAGEYQMLPPVTLSFSGGITTVTVTGNKEELAEEQVRIAVQQRVVGIIPNFYSSYDWNAPPMEAKQKFQLSIRSILDPVSLLAVAGIAGAEQFEGVFPAYGSGIEGYGKRYGAALATHVSATLLSRAVYPSILHQDPRYFYKGKGSIRSRALYAMSAAVMTRDDDGRWRPNYSNVLGNFSAGAISNLYYPSSDRGASLVFLNGLAHLGGDAVSNLVREFVLKGLTSHVPKGANGQP